jgi:hypothetical protein
VYGDRESIPPGDGSRAASKLTCGEPLRLIPLEDGQFLKALHPQLDGRISTDVEYGTTRQWALALYGWYPDAQGIRYTARHATPHPNYCLFLDRCPNALRADREGTLDQLDELVTLACAAYGLAPRLHEPADKGGW